MYPSTKRGLLLASAALVNVAAWTAAQPVGAQDATWLPRQGSTDFNAGANWSTNAVPTGIATFGASNTANLTFSGSATLGGFSLTAFAPAYSFSINGDTLTFNGTGIVINGGSATFNLQAGRDAAVIFAGSSTAGTATLTGVGLNFENNSSAGNATLLNVSSLNFVNNSTAGNATITNRDTLQFQNASKAGSAAITNNTGGSIEFYGTTTADNSVITNNADITFFASSTAGSAAVTTNNGGNVRFVQTSSGGDARFITNLGGTFDISGLAAAGMTAGSIEGAGSYLLGAKALTVGSNNRSTEVAGVIAGAGGSLIKSGSGVLTLSGTNTYAGATEVNGGTLAVDGSIATSSGVVVNNGGTLRGIGTVAGTTIANGGALAPGNSIGTITVNGDLTFNTGGIYTVEVSPTAADRTNVTGIATLTGGRVQAVALPGSFRPQTYTILNATGGLGGTQFASITATGSFSPTRPRLTYDTNNVYLVLDPGAIQLPAGAGAAQASVASGINNAVLGGATPPAGFDTLLNMSGSQLTNALNQVAGQPANGAATSGTQMTTSFLTLLLNPNGGALGGNTFGGARSFAPEPRLTPEAAAAYAAVTPKDNRAAVFAQSPWSVWGQVYGGYNRTSNDSAETSSSTWGLATGFDYRAAPDLTFGFALAGGSTNWGLSQGLGGGSSEMAQLGAYGRKDFGSAYVSAALSYAWHTMRTDRTVTVSGSDKLAARFDAHSFGGRVEAGNRFASRWVDVTPYAALQMQSFRTPSYSESAVSGSNTFALSYEARSTTSTRTELGAWFDHTIALDRGHALALRSRAAWAYDRSSNSSTRAVFQTLPGSNFTVNGGENAPNSLLASIAAELRLINRWSVGARFDGELASRSQTYAGTGTVRYAW
jgi:outer membrane autotransporter protein